MSTLQRHRLSRWVHRHPSDAIVALVVLGLVARLVTRGRLGLSRSRA